MSINIVDRRKITRDRTVENRQRFLRRIKDTIKEQLPDLINRRKLKDVDSQGGKIFVKNKTVHEPWLHHDKGGNIDRVYPGNVDYIAGDYIEKPKSGSSKRGSDASDGEDSEDEFVVELSREEFIEHFFEDLELPEMVKTELSKIKEVTRENAGFQPQGTPKNLALVRSYKNSFGRRLAVTKSIDEQIEECKRQIEVHCSMRYTQEQRDEFKSAIDALYAQIIELEARKARVPWLEEMDLSYRTTTIKEHPSSHATMILVMDNSGSMGHKEKTIARKFFWLLYKFLHRNYDQIDLRFISHTTTAREMDEEEFFNTRDSGGTLVSSALDEVTRVIKGEGIDHIGNARQPLIDKTNIYVAQVSDGDNIDTDNGTCSEILDDDILPHVQYYSYVQVDNSYHRSMSIAALLAEQGLWRTYSQASAKNPKLQARKVTEERDIFPVFHELFKKKAST